MDHNPFRTTRGYLNHAPAAKWAAATGSVAAAVALLALFPLFYLLVDLLAGRGQVPAFAALPAGRQAAFRAEWDDRLAQDPGVQERWRKLGPDRAAGHPAVEWELKWEAATHAWLADAAGPDAAEAYLPLAGAAPGTYPAPARHPLGVLGTAARERHHWTGALLGRLARWNPWAWQWDADRGTNTAYLTGLFALALAAAALRGLFLLVAAVAAARCAIAATSRLRRAVYTHCFRLPALATSPAAQAEAGDLLTDRVEAVYDGYLAWLTAAARGPVLVAGLLALLLAGHFWLALSLLLFGALVWVVAGQPAGWFRHDARVAARRSESRLALLRESLAVMPLVKGYLMERFGQTRAERHLAELGRAAWRRQRGEAVARSALISVALLAGLLMVYLAARVVLAGEMTVAGFALQAAVLGTLAFATYRWIAARVRVARAKEAAAEVVEFLDRRGEVGQGVDAEFLQPLARRLDFVGVSLREPGTGRMILEDVSLALPAGEKAAVVYADQTEAHALAYLVARFIDPTAGEIKFDGKNARWVTYDSLRTQVGLVLEQSLTFSDTVANNIGCGDPGFGLPQVIEAAKHAHAHQFVQSLPYGYETVIGDGGTALRVGERFRIALARALLRDPSLLVIEEPSEPVDPDSLVLIDDALARHTAGRTVLFLARRPATVKAADRVFVLQNGRLAASGRHDELLEGSELYRLLHFKQTLTTPEPV